MQVVAGQLRGRRVHWTNDTDEGWVLAIFRIDAAGRIAHHEVIAANA